MKQQSEQLLNGLISMCEKHQKWLTEINSHTETELQAKPGPGAWNALECIEHLNRYGRYYLPEFRQRIAGARYRNKSMFKSRSLRSYSANSMLPKPGFKSIKTFTNMNPADSRLSPSVIEEFSYQLKEMIELLNLARSVDLGRVRTSISISKLIKLKLGDTFRVVIYHNERHLVQAKRAIYYSNHPRAVAT